MRLTGLGQRKRRKSKTRSPPFTYSSNHGAIQNLLSWSRVNLHASSSASPTSSSSGLALLIKRCSRSSSCSSLLIWPSSSSSEDISISTGDEERSLLGELRAWWAAPSVQGHGR